MDVPIHLLVVNPRKVNPVRASSVIRFFKEVATCAREGRRKYFMHNLSCRYDWVWAMRYCIMPRLDGRLRDIPLALRYPAFAKAMRENAIAVSTQRNQDMVAAYNEVNDHTFGDAMQHFLGRGGCGGAEGGCGFCIEEWTTHSIGECDDECSMCEWVARGFEYVDGRWVKQQEKV